MLDPRLFRLRGVRTGAFGIVALFFALFGLFYINAQYLQDVKGYSAPLTGVAVLPLGAVLMLVGPRSPRLAARLGERTTIVLGLALAAAGLALLSFWGAGTPYLLYAAMLALVSAGMGLALAPLSGIAMVGIKATEAGAASGLFNMTRNLGGAIGTAALETFFTKREQFHSAVINAHVSPLQPATRLRLATLQQYFEAHGVSDPASAAHQAVIAVGRIVHAQATLMGYADSFGLIGAVLTVAALSVTALKKGSAAGGGAH